MGKNRGRAIKEHVSRTHGQSQRGPGWEAGMTGGGGSGREKMETTVLEQQ